MKPGEIIGEWRVLRTLGKGGMGMVFLGQHVDDEHEIAAVKLFHAWADDDDGFRRFERECEVLQRLDHPGIVPLKHGRIGTGRDVGSGIYWMAMAYIDGPSLEARLDHGPLPPGYAAATFHRLADALEHAHTRGVFHRDLKPANIVLGIDGVRLVDFGIALQEEKTRLTAVGTFAGTLPYMPPEVVLDDRSRPDPALGDIYALGVVLYEALTGERAFQTERGLTDRERQMRILKAKMSGDVLDPGPGVPEALRRLVQSATAPRPEERVASWEAFKAQLSAVPFGPDVLTTEWADEASIDEPTADAPAEATVDVPAEAEPAVAAAFSREPTPRPRGPRGFGLARGETPSWSSEDAQDSDFHPGVAVSPVDAEEVVDDDGDEPTELTAPLVVPPPQPPQPPQPPKAAKPPPPPAPPPAKARKGARSANDVVASAPIVAPTASGAPIASVTTAPTAHASAPPSEGSSGRGRWIVAALLLLGLAAGGGYFALQPSPTSEATTARAGTAASSAPAGAPPAAGAPAAMPAVATAPTVPAASDAAGSPWSDTGEPTWEGHAWPTASKAEAPEIAAAPVATAAGKPTDKPVDKLVKPKPDAKAPAAVQKLKVFFQTVGGEVANVSINGKPRGATPLQLYLEPGPYRVEFTSSTGVPDSKEVEIATYGANEISFDPKRHRITNIHKE